MSVPTTMLYIIMTLNHCGGGQPRHLACRLGLGLVGRLGLGQVDRAIRHLNSATAAKTEYIHLAYLYLEYGIGSLRMRFHPR